MPNIIQGAFEENIAGLKEYAFVLNDKATNPVFVNMVNSITRIAQEVCLPENGIVISRSLDQSHPGLGFSPGFDADNNPTEAYIGLMSRLFSGVFKSRIENRWIYDDSIELLAEISKKKIIPIAIGIFEGNTSGQPPYIAVFFSKSGKLKPTVVHIHSQSPVYIGEYNGVPLIESSFYRPYSLSDGCSIDWEAVKRTFK